MRRRFARGAALLAAGLMLWGTGTAALAEEVPAAAGDGEYGEKGAEDSLLPNGKEIYNLLLIGTDRRDESWNGNSDVMIVATINTAAKKLCLTSFMRDLYAQIPGYGEHKLNYAYAAGGPETLMETIESNYQIDIDNYAVVDFETMSDIIDIVGGVEITVSDAEVSVLNGYLVSMEATEYSLPQGGTYLLNGKQAVAYMRIRFVGNNDYERTQRQRDVLQAMFEQFRDLDAKELAALTGGALLLVEHDIDMLSLVKLGVSLPEYMSYPLEESRIPYDGLFTSQNEMLVPDYGETIRRLHESMYEGIDWQYEEETSGETELSSDGEELLEEAEPVLSGQELAETQE